MIVVRTFYPVSDLVEFTLKERVEVEIGLSIRVKDGIDELHADKLLKCNWEGGQHNIDEKGWTVDPD